MPDSAARRWLASRRLWVQLCVAAALGALAALGQAPLDLWPLTLLAFAGLYGCYAASPGWRRATWLGLGGGAGYFAVALSWIIEPFLIDVARHGWMAPFALLFSAFGFALFWAGAMGLARRLGGGAVTWAAVLTLSEALRGWLWTGFPWAQPGHVLIPTPLLHWAAVGGALPLTLLVLLAGASLWHLALGRRVAGGAGVALFAALFAIVPHLGEVPAAGPDAPTIRLVQPNVPQQQKWDPAHMQAHFDRQMRYTSADAPPDLIVWPETALPTLLDHAGELLDAIADAARGAPVVLGVQRAEGARYYNSLLLLDGQGREAALYDKHHLVPFGEYVPFGDLLGRIGIRGLAQQGGFGYSPGPGAQVIDMGAMGKALPLICYEGVFARDVAAAEGRADYLLLITNDAWFGKVSGPFQHLAQARLRSAEQGLPMIRAANTGISAIIDAGGRITAEIPLGEAGYLDAVLPPPAPPTIYARSGDLPALAILAFLALVPAALRRRRKPRVARG
ncbi:apolipoprotein N-acyltransferase [Pelagivirga sediminicola]|uniref:Apolipoprotein N-acyltransferase n=1 Tax=Pelagivirga sediminicola TaxID=2170575 RepID=A0A2T7G447_9RHOB|nr:apolipoprotein N-acyltransferase [Pelagivirga sediminicola]PVA09192.1 apolipoprotein N-acyltransferase [Pelagivirga sediminicola]